MLHQKNVVILHANLCDMTSYKFNLNTMRIPKAELQYKIEADFFEGKDYSPVHEGCVDVNVQILKKEGEFNVKIGMKGYVVTTCTRCMDDLNVDIESDDEVMVKLTKTPREDDDYVYVVDTEGELDLEPLIYDFIILAIPERHVHADGECNEEMESRLKQYLVN